MCSSDLFGASLSLGYTWLTQRFPPELAGRVTTGLNLLVFVAAFAVQSGVGGIIVWVGEAPAWIGHGIALSILVALQLAGIAWFLWPRSAPLPPLATAPPPDHTRA